MQGSVPRARLRWLGLVGAAAMAASAYLAGTPSPHGPAWVVGVALWVAGAGGLLAVWWRLRTVADLRWLLLTGALWALPLLLAPPLGSHDSYAYACQGELVTAGLDPYRNGAAALPCRWLEHVAPSWRDTPTPYGPLWLFVERIATSAGLLGSAGLPVTVTVLRLVAIGGTLLAVVAGIRLARRCGGDPARVAWLAATSPLTLVHVVSGAHNDALLAGLVVAGLAVAATDRVDVPTRLALAGAAFGAAASVKATALVVVPFAVAVVPWARTGRRQVTAVLILLAATGGTFGLLAVLTGHGLGFLHGWSATAGSVQWSSVPTGVGMAVGYGLRAVGRPELFAGAVTVTRAAGLVALAVILVLLLRRAVRGGTGAAVPAAGLALLATAVLGPVFYAWYALAGVAVLATAPKRPGRLGDLLDAGSAGLVLLTLPNSLGLVTKTKVAGALLDVCLVLWALASRLRPTRPPAWRRTAGRPRLPLLRLRDSGAAGRPG
ncbi:polyprenol phosphomannose-dependent alpha 1,6 mannosyltransferase MptB [Plantactinospora sonchi]|uniref:Polyprenol phosphomannose-dependent alpha 1,6 mannosyltransferase MptB n=1 Tax=Plantactinospora sonchi TaxID=1544735 RepID=A0ABU7S173_9ACTN